MAGRYRSAPSEDLQAQTDLVPGHSVAQAGFKSLVINSAHVVIRYPPSFILSEHPTITPNTVILQSFQGLDSNIQYSGSIIVCCQAE